MSSSSSSLLYLIILAVACISTSHYRVANCDQPSTVFVLETSDSSDSSSASVSGPASVQHHQPASSESSSSSSSAANKRELNEDSNTRIVTDNAAPSGAIQSQGSHHVHSSTTQRPNELRKYSSIDSHSSTTQSPGSHHQHQADQPQANSNNESSHESSKAGHESAKPRELSTVRRIDDSDSPTPAAGQHQRSTNTAIRSTSQQQNRPKSATSTTSSPYSSYEANDQPTRPKTEERLLISITSNEDEYKPPQRQVIASNGGFDELNPGQSSSSSSSQQQQSPQNPKRKPSSITISIHDNSNKQGSGTPAVILRPSENGQSIVISTLGSSSIEPNKYNQNTGLKPAIAIVSSNNGHHNINNNNNNNNNNNHDSNEPLDIPLPSGSHLSNLGPATHRPSSLVNSEYNPPANKPIVSTLIDQPRPPVNLLSTQRPISLNEDYQPIRPPTSAPAYQNPRPTSTSQPDYNNNNNNENNNNGPESESIGSGGGGGGNSGPINSQAESRYPLNERNCGLVHETKIVGGEEADPDDFLWMAAIVKSRPKEGESRPFCGGSLITRRHILTAAHCLENLAPRDVLVRLGSYDFDDSTASSLSADFAIDQFRVPAQYSKKTHVADIAIMRLKTPLQLSDNYKTVCMPQARRSYVGALGTVTGYGSQSQTFRRAAPKLRQVTVPIWENRKCSAVYKKNLTESFLCAGYEEGGKDACQGDSGGPLMTEGPNQRMMVVGVVSHGIGCGSPGIPGVYTRTTTFLEWIEKNTRE